MNFTTGIEEYVQNYNTNAIGDYNKYLKSNASFAFDSKVNEFDSLLETAGKQYPIHDKQDPEGLGNFASQFGSAIGNSLNAVNNAKIQADMMQEDIAMGGSTDIHAAMIAAEKASLSMQMAIQVRNRILSAYTDITTMGI